MKKILTALMLGSLLSVPLARAEDAKTTLKITGMTCEQCAAGVKRSLMKLDGVKTADVSFENSRAVVTYDAAKVTTAKLVATVGEAGAFKAEPATGPAKKTQQIYCEGKSAGQLCGEGTVAALQLSGAKKAAWEQAVRRYNSAVEAATRQVLRDAEATLSPQELAVVKQWFAKGVNTRINQQLAKEGK